MVQLSEKFPGVYILGFYVTLCCISFKSKLQVLVFWNSVQASAFSYTLSNLSSYEKNK